MKNKRWLQAACAALTLLCLSACSSTETEELPKTIRNADKTVSISVPEAWTEYATEGKDNLILAVEDGSGTYAQIFLYPPVEDKELTALDYVDEAQNYYGSAITGSEAAVMVAGNNGYYFAYKLSVTDEEDVILSTFQGYEYFIPFSGTIVEVDIFFEYTDTAPTNEMLAQLRSIAETVRYRG